MMHSQDVRRLCVSLVFLAMTALPAHAAESPSRVTDQAIDEQMYIEIGGIKQWITIRGADSNNPVVLILHGGPGAAFSPFDESAFGKWRPYFTVVHWDQRGAGRTYSKTGPSVEATMSMDRMVADGIEVAEYLVQHLHQRKIVLFGGSWGSILGVHMVKRRPDLFYAYVGTAQVVNSTQQALAKKYSNFLATARAADDQKAISEVGALGPPPWNSLDTFFAFIRWIGTYEGKASTALNMTVSNEYASKQERDDWAAAMTMSVKHFFGPRLDGPLMHVDLRELGTEFAVPIFIVQGQDDLRAPADAAKAYFDEITAPKKQFLLAPRTGHEPSPISMDLIFGVLVEQVRPLCR